MSKRGNAEDILCDEALVMDSAGAGRPAGSVALYLSDTDDAIDHLVDDRLQCHGQQVLQLVAEDVHDASTVVLQGGCRPTAVLLISFPCSF